MAFCHRIGNSKLKTAYNQFRRCYIHLPYPSFPKLRSTEIPNPYSFLQGNTSTNVYNSVRFFAAPIQFQKKPKNEEDEIDGPRLNEQIKAKYIRLVREDGSHSVVSRFEAFEQARNLKLDLVEVHKQNPPVCKIMDYHKEMYKRQERDKERAKSKADMTLRRECKEVRVSEKTESKDLKCKADMVRKLMDKGYRVKCKATGSDNQNMIEKLSGLSALIEDICVVESGPHLTKKEAFMVVRHIKYGAARKNGKKWQDITTMAVKAEEGDVEPLTASSSDSIQHENQSSGESWFETKEEILYENQGNDPISTASLENRYKRAADENNVRNNAQRNDSVSPASLENRYKRASGENTVRNNAQSPPAVTENRYKRAEPRNRFPQTPPNTSPGIRDADRRTPLNLNQTRHDPRENTRQGFNSPPGSRNPMPPREDPGAHNTRSPGYVSFSSTPGSRNSMPSREDPRVHNTRSPGYGSFSSTPRGPHTAGMHRNREGNS